MIVCVCMRISDRDIRSRRQAGIDSVDELQMETGCGTRCGKCLPHVERELQGHGHASGSGGGCRGPMDAELG